MLIGKMLIPLKLICRFNVIPIKAPGFYRDDLFLKLYGKERYRLAKRILKNKNKVGRITPLIFRLIIELQ